LNTYGNSACPSPFLTLANISTTNDITPYSSTISSTDTIPCTLKRDSLSPFLFTLFLETFLKWLAVGSRDHRPRAATTPINLR
jgi:hypothetical protein